MARTVSFSRTPQAHDDFASDTENGSLVIDVMQNDLGGAAKTLYSLAPVSESDLLTATTCSQSRLGAALEIVDGRIVYDPTNSSALDALAAGETAVDSFVYAIRMGDGTLSTAEVFVTVTGTNDAPVVASTDLAGEITEAAAPSGALADSGTIAFTDADLSDVHTVGPVTASAGALGTLTAAVSTDTTGTGTGGGISWNYGVDAAAVEYLAAGETKIESFSFALDDGNGGTVERTVQVTVTGTNDGPVIGAEDVAGAVTEAGVPSGALADSGTIAFSDVDLRDVHSVGAVTASAGALGTLAAAVSADTTGSGTGGEISWNYSVDAAAVEYLAAGETKIESFSFALDDGNGGTVERTVQVTVTGSNDGPQITSAAQAASITELDDLAAGENVATHTRSGQITFTDVDTLDTHTASVTPAGSGYLGTLSLAPLDQAGDSVGWQFSVADSALDALQAGQTLTQDYDVQVSDGKGGVATQQVTVTLTGSNDAPVIVAAPVSTFADRVVAFTGGSGYGVEPYNPTANSTYSGPAGPGTFDPSAVTQFDGVSLALGGTPDAPGSVIVQFQSGAVLDGDGTDLRIYDSFGLSEGFKLQASADGTNFVDVGTYTGGPAVMRDGIQTYQTDVDLSGSGLHSASYFRISTANPVVYFYPQALDLDAVEAVHFSASTSNAISEIADLAAGENATTHTRSGSIAFSDVDTLDTHTASVVAQGSDYRGTFTLGAVDDAADGVGWSFSVADADLDDLQAGQTLTQDYTVAISDGHGGTATQVVTVTLTGSNDAPLAVSPPQAADVTEIADGAAGENTATHSQSGTFAFSDPDLLDLHAASVTPAGSGYLGTFSLGAVDESADNVGWNFSVADNLLDSLRAGQVLVQDYQISVSDGQGGTVTQDVSVRMTGSNDAATISGLSSGSLREDSVLTTGGTLSVADPDNGENLFGDVGPLTGQYGTFTFNTSNGAWGYTLNNTAANVQSLADGQVVHDSLLVKSLDGTASRAITVDITGAAEAPTGTVIDFEDLALAIGSIPDGYHGFNWHVPNGYNLYVLDGTQSSYVGTGYQTGIVSGTHVAFDPFAYEPVTITRSNGADFTFNAVDLTSAWDVNQDVVLTGYNNGAAVGSVSLTAHNSGPTLVTANWGPIDTLVIDALNGAQMVYDNFVFGL